MKEIDVIRGADLKRGETTPGILRDKAFETDGALFARSRVAVGVKSGWHHHGSRELFGFLVSGRLQFDYGKAGVDSVEVGPGEFFHISVGVVHRDVNPDKNQEAVVVNILIGIGPPVVNVPGP
jgi:mannose-6-phosphate isomerase-like protein (cupin superfamily)